VAITIRTASPADLDAIAPLFDAYRQFFTKAADIDVSRRFLSERLERSESTILAAYDGETAAGFLQLYPLFSSWHAMRQWFLSDLFVAPALRERGIGKRLVRASIDFAKQTKARAILVELPFSEPHLARFYGELGFGKDEIFELHRLAISARPG
jgi:GNAT superfamily N-acetyltransferase